MDWHLGIQEHFGKGFHNLCSPAIQQWYMHKESAFKAFSLKKKKGQIYHKWVFI